MNGVFHRLYYALTEYKRKGETTLILGAGCSLSSTIKDVSTIGIMKESLYEHNIAIDDEKNWEDIYSNFINVVWSGKTEREQRELLNKRFEGMTPTNAHKCLKNLIEAGYINNIITTNFDLLIETVCEDMSYLKRTGEMGYSKHGNAEPKFNLLKVHGDLDSGILRFSPAELMKLSPDLSNDINKKTLGLTIFIGYRGQDVGLMNSINCNSSSSMFWIDISGPYNQNSYEAQKIINLLSARESLENVLSGKKFGDFNNILPELNSILVLKNHKSIINAQKKHLISEWQDTSILDVLSINSRFYDLFLGILYCSKIISDSHQCDVQLYSSCLQAYLYVFKKKLLPSKLVNIPNNEVDALILGVAFEIVIRAFCLNITTLDYANKLNDTFIKDIDSNILFDSTFWDIIKDIISLKESSVINQIKLNFKNEHLKIESINIPFTDLSNVMRIIKILSAVTFPYTKNVKYKVFYGKEESLRCFNNKIHIDLGEIETDEKSFINDSLVKGLPFYQTCIVDNQVNIISKWLDIKFSVKDDDFISKDSIYIFCLKQCDKTTKEFLNLNNICNQKYIELRLDNDINDFIFSDKTAIFITGSSGSGKTSAVRNFMLKNKELHFSIVSSKVNQTDYLNLSAFLGIEIDASEEESVINTLNKALKINNSRIILIIDGINELNFEFQKQYYLKINDLARKIYNLKCNNIKIIVTCREHAYLQYKDTTGVNLNYLYFYRNDKSEFGIVQNQDANYKVKPFNDNEFSALLKCYFSDDKIIDAIKNIKIQNMTPFYFAIIDEYLQTYSIESLDFNNNNLLFEVLSKTMFGRLTKTNQLFAKRIIFTYFDLIINCNLLYVTKYMIENALLSDGNMNESAYYIDVFNALVDVNILATDFSKHNNIKFSHDKIEEFFFEKYLEEYIVINNETLEKVLHLCKINLIYKEGFVQFLINEANENLGVFKKILTDNYSGNMDILPKLTIEAVSHFNNLESDLKYLLHDRDYNDSKALINIIISGMEESLISYFLYTYDLINIIDIILCIRSKVIDNDVKSYMYYFKSRLLYFNNDYDGALEYTDKSISTINPNNLSFSTNLNMNKAVILMEIGHSSDSITILQSEFDKYNKDYDIRNKIRIGIELGRVLNHNGKIKEPLELYDELLTYKEQITEPYILARICEQKGNSLNKIMFEKLHYGFVSISNIEKDCLIDVKKLFSEAINLYEDAMNLLIKENEVFCYSGVVPEKINTYVSYSMSVNEIGMDECKTLIKKVDKLFEDITTPYKTDFNLAKAYYYEYLGNIDKAMECMECALENSLDLKNQNKEAKCNLFYAQFAYRRILKLQQNKNEMAKWKSLGLECIDKALRYYMHYTINNDNYNIRLCNNLTALFNDLI